MADELKQVNCFLPADDWATIDQAFAAVIARKGLMIRGKKMTKNDWLRGILMKEARAELRRAKKDAS